MTNENQPDLEEQRKIALSNLKSNTILDLATAYFVDSTGQYGEAVGSAVEKFKYLPAMQTKEAYDLISKSMLESRQKGKRYSGNVSEYKVIEDCAKIVQESLMSIKVQDILDLINSKEKINENYKDKYVSELGETDEEAFKNIIGLYQTYITDTKVSEALSEKSKTIKSGLEEILKEPEKEVK